MCGIYGVASGPLRLQDRQREVRSEVDSSALKNRGPDGSGVFKRDNLLLYHARLAVIDASETARQPIESPGSVVVCNGEIYNHRSIRAEQRDFTFATSSDCEAISAVYAAGGVAAFSRLDGMFAFALADVQQGRLYLYRDAVGKKPLFYYHKDGLLVFSSSVRCITDNLKVPLTADLEQVRFFRENGYIRPQASIYLEILPVLPGELLEFDMNSGSLQSRQLHPEEARCDIDPLASTDKILDAISARIDAAIIKRTNGVRNRVLLFSGGVDSTYIASRLKAIVGPAALVTMRQPLGWLNDAPYARVAARQLGQELRAVGAKMAVALDDVIDMIVRLDQPLALSTYFTMTPLARTARDFGNVLLTGDGADEAFFGYISINDWKGNKSSSPENWIQSGPSFGWPLSVTGAYLAGTGLVGHQFVKVDKATAENQMEARCPFLDWELNSLLRSLPFAFFERFQGVKGVLKALLLREGFGEAFVHRKKVGSSYPLRYALIASIPRMLRKTREHDHLLRKLGFNRIDGMTQGFIRFSDLFKQYVLSVFLEQNARFLAAVQSASAGNPASCPNE